MNPVPEEPNDRQVRRAVKRAEDARSLDVGEVAATLLAARGESLERVEAVARRTAMPG